MTRFNCIDGYKIDTEDKYRTDSEKEINRSLINSNPSILSIRKNIRLGD